MIPALISRLLFYSRRDVSSAKNYGTVIHTLAKNYRIIAPEVPGFTNDYYPDKFLGLDELAIFFNELLEKAQLPQYYIIGHSMGRRNSNFNGNQ